MGMLSDHEYEVEKLKKLEKEINHIEKIELRDIKDKLENKFTPKLSFIYDQKISMLEDLKEEYRERIDKLERKLYENDVEPADALEMAKAISFRTRFRYLEYLREQLINREDLSQEFLTDLVRADGGAIFYIPEKYVNQELILEAIKDEPYALVLSTDGKGFEDKSFIEKVIKINSDALLKLKGIDPEAKLRDMGLLDKFLDFKANEIIKNVMERYGSEFANKLPEQIYLSAVMTMYKNNNLPNSADAIMQLVEEKLKEKMEEFKENPQEFIAKLEEKVNIEEQNISDEKYSRLKKEVELEELQEEDARLDEEIEKAEQRNLQENYQDNPDNEQK